MQWIFNLQSLSFGLLAVTALTLTGCQEGDVAQQKPAESTEVAHADHADGEAGHEEHDHAGHGHGGFWCSEHGVPEEVCARCDTSLIAQFKEEGDWCEKHNRPDSHCFVCDPDRFEKFAARYKAKMGEEPPTPDALKETSGS